jgi:hypothetical protein
VLEGVHAKNVREVGALGHTRSKDPNLASSENNAVLVMIKKSLRTALARSKR